MYNFIKRFFDILASFIALISLSPFLIPIVIILKLTGDHDVFFLEKKTRLKIEVLQIVIVDISHRYATAVVLIDVYNHIVLIVFQNLVLKINARFCWSKQLKPWVFSRQSGFYPRIIP